MKHLIVGTAGHVDHGKTALIKYLTGTDTDRLKEEKSRGISIDIGFAVLRLEEMITLGIVDVPGHERFLKNMLAGTGGIDLVLLIVAADEGIMPQTREHFEMLQCFGVRNGIVVITKIDKVESEWIDLVEEEIHAYLSGTFLADAPLCKISSVSGDGMNDLRRTLLEEGKKIVERDKTAPFRLWIDRAFNLKGHGLIVTGSVLSGDASTGDTLILQPSGEMVKIREIETHNQSVAQVGAGQRASLKLSGISLAEASRGMCLCAAGYGQKSQAWEGFVVWHTRFPSGTRVRFHIGTAEYIGRMAYTGPSEAAEIYVRIYLEQPLAAGLGDQGLLRRYSPQNLIGGLILLRPLERGLQKRELMDQLMQNVKKNDLAGVMHNLLSFAKEPLTFSEWIVRVGYHHAGNAAKIIKQLLHNGVVKQAGNYYISASQLIRLQTNLVEILTEYHHRYPAEAGISREVLRQKIKLPTQIVDWFYQDAAKLGLIVVREEFIALPTHFAQHGALKKQLMLRFEKLMPVQEIIEVTPEWIAEKMQCSITESKQFFETLVREKIVIRLTGVHVYRKTIQYIGAVIQQHFHSHSTLSVGELRDLLGTSRRLAIPVLEYFDSHKNTIRIGDNRVPGPNLTNLSE